MRKSAILLCLAAAVVSAQGPGPSGTWLQWIRAPYEARRIAPFSRANSHRLQELLRGGNLYLSLADAIALAIENNLDVEIARYEMPTANSEVLRAKGGGVLRGIPYTVAEVPAGVGGPVSPLITGTATGSTPTTSVPSNVSELPALVGVEDSLGILPGAFAAGPPIPIYDPTITGSLMWEHQTTPEPTTFGTGTNTLRTNSTTGSLGLQQGFSWGTQYSLNYTTLSESLNSTTSNYNPYTSGSLGLTITQPLLRGFGAAVNRRFIRIAENDQKIGNLVFQQQLINTVYGVSRLYYDLAALADDVQVKRETLTAARTLYQNTKSQVEEGTLAPVELTRAEAEVAGSEQDLVNSEGLFSEQEVIMKNVLTRRGTMDPEIRAAHIITTESLRVPDKEPEGNLDNMVSAALNSRPDLKQAALQLTNAQIYLKGTRNELLPEVDVVALAQSTGLAGTMNALNPALTSGAAAMNMLPYLGGYGSSLSQIFSIKSPAYGVGVQLNLPLRNRVAQADVVRDEIQVRQTEARLLQLRNQAQLEVDDAVIALRRARAAYDAAVKTRQLQAQSVEIEELRLENGVSTAFFVIQYQSYLAQARSTEVAARGNYFKARATLDRAIGQTLERNEVSVQEAYNGRIARPPAALPAKP